MSINSLTNGFKNTTHRALEACCEHTAARNAAYPATLSHGHGEVVMSWLKELCWGSWSTLICNQGVRLYSGHDSHMGANSSCLSDSKMFFYYSMISICDDTTMLDTSSILVSYIFRA